MKSTATRTLDIASAGRALPKQIEVRISPEILGLFSQGLYSSPNKAIEELVANSYDALAHSVSVVIPEDLSAPDSTIWVVDDGEGMTAAGLQALWWIGRSIKTEPAAQRRSRPPVGKFGIGKLATYVLGHELTYVTKSADGFLAVTTDFDQLDGHLPDDRLDTQGTESHGTRVAAGLGQLQTVKLTIRKLTEDQATAILQPLIPQAPNEKSPIQLFGENSPKSWTVVGVRHLTDTARSLKRGFLEWVLSSLLPLNDEFHLYVNGLRLTSAKIKLQPIQEWTVGAKDAPAAELNYESTGNPVGIRIPGIPGVITGSVSLYEDPLTEGKAIRVGRSHGFFVRIRKRLVNFEDELFGLDAVSHATFNRFRMEIEADGLNDLLRSNRETVLGTPSVSELRAYLLAKFNEVRVFYTNWLEQQEQEHRLSTRIARTPHSLSRKPIIDAIRYSILEGEPLTMIRSPSFPDVEAAKGFLGNLESDAKSEAGLVHEVTFAALGPDRKIAEFDAETRTLYVNSLHPFYAIYSDRIKKDEAYELIATAEVLIEPFMLDAGVTLPIAREVLERRDRYFRELVASKQLAAPAVARLLRDFRNEPTQLRQVVAQALLSLGLQVSPAGTKSSMDGIAVARLGYRADGSASPANYAIVYQTRLAKFSEAGKIARIRDKNHAKFALVVLPDDGTSPIRRMEENAHEERVTFVRVRELERLVLGAATRGFSFGRLEQMFETCRTPEAVEKWLDKFLAEPVERGPIKEIIEAIWELQEERPERVRIAAVPVANPRIRKLRLKTSEVVEWVQSIRRLVGPFVTIDGEFISLETSPTQILERLNIAVERLPQDFRSATIWPVNPQAA